MITQARPSSAIFCAKIRSCSITPAVASNIKSTTSERRIARNARLTIKNSGPYSIFPFLRIPAVSTNRYIVDGTSGPEPGGGGRSINASIESRVVPATSETMARVSPKIAFNKDDFPTFGRPIIAILISSGRVSASNASIAA